MKYNKFNNKYRKILAVIGLSVILAGCGNSTGNVSVEPMPSTSVETDSAVEAPEISEPVLEDSDEEPVEEQIDDRFADATMIQTGENEYIIYADCPDNSNAPEISETLSRGDSVYFGGDGADFGISQNLIIAVMTHGLQTNPNNPTGINFDVWKDKPYDRIFKSLGSRSCVITTDQSLYNYPAYIQSDFKLDASGQISPNSLDACLTLLYSCITNTKGNITCAISLYEYGPDAWNQSMQECMDATGLTADEIYANYDATYVYQYDTLGLGSSTYANEVLKYIGDENIMITMFNPKNGVTEYTTTYTIERVNE